MPKSERVKLLDKVKAAWNAYLKVKAQKATRKHKYEATKTVMAIKKREVGEARKTLLDKFPDANVELPAEMFDHDSDSASSSSCDEFEHVG